MMKFKLRIKTWIFLAAGTMLVAQAAAIAQDNGAKTRDRGQSVVASLPRGPSASPLAPRSAPLPNAFAAVGGQTSVPIGWIEFCASAMGAQDCDVPALPSRDVEMTAAKWRQVERINRSVNKAITPVSDLDNYGVEELWTYSENGQGDCEDYVLHKRRALIQAGFPRQALLITVVKDRQGEGHAILTLRTKAGDYALDNKRDDIVSWNETGYKFIKRQSQDNPNRWVALRGGDAPAATAAR